MVFTMIDDRRSMIDGKPGGEKKVGSGVVDSWWTLFRLFRIKMYQPLRHEPPYCSIIDQAFHKHPYPPVSFFRPQKLFLSNKS